MTTFLSQGIDYLGFLDAKLRDLQGYASLAHELIQNADDAEAAHMSFDVRDEALIVQNTSTFSDCGEIEADECPWKASSAYNHRCDFHRFRKVAGGDKREQEATTGAFGIGFISVYQVTDRPELLSGHHHWIIRPDAEERKRIEVVRNGDEPFAGTRFILPWAADNTSRLRQRLRAQPICISEATATFLEVLTRTLPDAILFLKHLRRIDLRRNGQIVTTIERTDEGNQIVVQSGSEVRLWHTLRGSFDAEAERFRETYAGQIEQKRTAHVIVAVPEHAISLNGLFCACLPTEQHTDLPFHINADFYPSTDRKRILFSDDHQGAWNRAAITEAARLVGAAIPSLPNLLGPAALWDLFARLKKAHDQATEGQIDHVFEQFWSRAQSHIKGAPTVATWPEGWQMPAKVYLLERQEEEVALPLLRDIGLSLVHPELRRHFSLLRAVDVPILGLADLVQALKGAGLDKTIMQGEAPHWIQPREKRDLLGREIAILSEQRVKREVLDLARQEIRRCAIAVARDGWLCSPENLFSPADDLVAMLVALGCEKILIAEDNPPGIVALVEPLTLTQMLRVLEDVPRECFNMLWREQKAILFSIVDWFAGQSQAVLADEKTKAQLSALPIWPSGQALFPLSDLYIAGKFDDPLGLASLLDREMRRDRQDFLRGLGYKWLTLQSYARDLVPRALQTQETIGTSQRRQLLLLFAEHFGELRDDIETRKALIQCPLVECNNGEFHVGRQVYFDTTDGVEVLGSVPLARILPERREAIRDLYHWLGVADELRLDDIIRQLTPIIAEPPNEEGRHVVGQIFRLLSSRRLAPNEPALQILRNRRWLPARNDASRWFAPNELYATYQDYLFSSQGRFIALDRPVQNQGRDFLDLLGVHISPTPQQVVKHLLWCATQKQPVNLEVYRFLNEKVEDDAILQLRETACLMLEGVGYVPPSHVFWNDHPYGRFRYRLTADLRSYNRLFTQLRVRETPTIADAFLVMGEIAKAFQRSGEPLDESANTVLLACWQQLNDALEQGELALGELKKLTTLPVVPTENGRLRPPMEMFQDDRPGLVSRFRNFQGEHTIARMLGTWRSMEAAGVRPLSKAVQVSLVECDLPESADDLTSLIRERQHLIIRVVESVKGDSEQIYDLEFLNRISVERVAQLTIDYSLRVPGLRAWISEPEHVPAHLDAENDVIYIQRQHSALQWPAFARALAVALDPHGDPVQLATGLKEVLSADSVHDAAAVLDMLGYAQVVIVETTRVEQSSIGLGAEAHIPPESDPSIDSPEASLIKPDDIDASSGLGESTTPINTGQESSATGTRSVKPDERNGASDLSAAVDFSNETPGSVDGRTQTGVMEPANNTSSSTKGIYRSGTEASMEFPTSANGSAKAAQHGMAGAQGESKDIGEENGIPSGDTPTTEDSTANSNRVQRQRGKLRTYVTSGGMDIAIDGLDMAAHITAIDKAGIERVLQFERDAGRFPREMHHNNPGYDIESCSITGHIVRYIEVKSTSSYWDSQGVGLSKEQFSRANVYEDDYWLYVVERAEHDDARIYPIQNPARRVDQFFYDSGWQALAEQMDQTFINNTIITTLSEES